ncbi:MarR family transcriptional regulator [Agrobacterium sp. a22-2]|uniref:MarR family winged helix-turn-helix transcriptional regulator n=1 Tax=Agrobacterium sp. a22-2 TaxID=2283840 RepID=UPI001447CF65|nr:MarR family transcriptional regulator [Agrobacterium sp. a22-2]NKN34755.1 MarR family transcriptional regulator [Agrobacterium sp. a22-2]
MTSHEKSQTLPPLSLDSFLCFAVYSAGHAFNQLYRPLLDAIGLTYPQYLVMVALWSRDDQTVKDLGRALFLESSTLTPLIKRLEGMGYLTRSRDPVDERMVRVRLTADGLALREKARGIPACIAEATALEPEVLTKLIEQMTATRDAILKRAD